MFIPPRPQTEKHMGDALVVSLLRATLSAGTLALIIAGSADPFKHAKTQGQLETKDRGVFK